jgi:hypothetical protein
LGFVGSEAGPCHQIVSEEFLALLSSEEKAGLDFRATIRRGRRKFYELVGPDGPPFVAVTSLKPSGWRCSECGHREWAYWIDGMEIHSFVARRDLPGSLNGVFTVGTSPKVQLAVTGRRWRELVGRKGTRGFTSRPLGVAPDEQLANQPDLPTKEEQFLKSLEHARRVNKRRFRPPSY